MGDLYFDAEQRFLSCLTPELRLQINALPGLLHKHADSQIVFTARKSVCLADSLRRLGKWTPSSRTTSTRALDGDLSSLAGRDVLIVEDIAASGRTIRTTVDRVAAAGAGRVSVFALSMEGPREQWEKVLGVRIEEPYLDSTVSDSLRHTCSLIDAFAALPVPFNIDWPVYETRRSLPVKKLLEAGWTCEGARSSYKAHRPFTLEITREWATLMAAAMPSPLAELLSEIELAKLRVYPVVQPFANDVHAFVIPIAALGSLDAKEINELGAALGAWIGDEPVLGATPSESYRVLQYLISEVLIEFALRSSGIRPLAAQDAFLPYLFFGDTQTRLASITGRVRERARQSATKPAYLLPRRFRLVEGERSLEADRATLEGRAVADGALTNVFLRSYLDTNEYDLRTRLRKAPTDADRHDVLTALAGLDRSSFAAADLVVKLKDGWTSELASVHGDPAHLVSEFLDRAIDSGEVVPDVFSTNGAIVQRRFRAGEVIEFHRDVRTLVETMLHSFQTHSVAVDGVIEADEVTEGAPITGDLVQKLLVGYTRYMIDQGQRTDLRARPVTAENVERIQLRYHMRGAVLTTVDPDFVAETGDPSSLSLLVDDGVLKEVVAPTKSSGREKRTYRLSPRPVMGEPPASFAHGADLFGEVMAKLLRIPDPHDEKGESLFDEHAFARLVTLVNGDDQVLALGADIEIAMNFLASETQFTGPSALRSSDLATAINQGLAKAAWCLEHKGAERLRLAERILAESDGPGGRAIASVFSCLWPGDTVSTNQTLLRDEAVWLADAYRYLLVLEWLTANEIERARNSRTMAKALRNDALLAASKVAPRRPDDGRGRLQAFVEKHIEAGTTPERTQLAETIAPAVVQLLEDGRKLLRRCHRINATNQMQPAPSGRRAIPDCLLVSRNARIARRSGADISVHSLDESQIGTSLSGFETLVCLGKSCTSDTLIDVITEIRRGGNTDPIVVMLELPPEFAPAGTDDFDKIELRGSFTRLLEVVRRHARASGAVLVKTDRADSHLLEGLRPRRGRVERVDVLGETWEIIRLATPQRTSRPVRQAPIEGELLASNATAPELAVQPSPAPLVGQATNVFIGNNTTILHPADDRAKILLELMTLRDRLDADASDWQSFAAGSRAEIDESVEILGEAIVELEAGDEVAFTEKLSRLRKFGRWVGGYSTGVVSQVTATVITKALHLD